MAMLQSVVVSSNNSRRTMSLTGRLLKIWRSVRMPSIFTGRQGRSNGQSHPLTSKMRRVNRYALMRMRPKLTDFENSFEDGDSDYLEMIRIDSLPDNGVLLIEGKKVTNGQSIDIDQVEDLEFHPDENWNGESEFTWSGFDGQKWSGESSPVKIAIDYGVGGKGGSGSEKGSGFGGGEFGLFDGGDGEDTLVFEGSGLEIDLTFLNNGAITNIEGLDISGDGDNNLRLSAEDVFDMTDGDNKPFIDGNSGDSVEMSDNFVNQITENVDGVHYTHFYDAGADAHIYVKNEINDLGTF